MGQDLGDVASSYGVPPSSGRRGTWPRTGTGPRDPAPAVDRPSGGRRRSGASPIRLRICTTAGRGRSTRPSGSMAARPRRPPGDTRKLSRGDRSALLQVPPLADDRQAGRRKPPRSTPSRPGAITRTPPTRENDPVGVEIRAHRQGKIEAGAWLRLAPAVAASGPRSSARPPGRGDSTCTSAAERQGASMIGNQRRAWVRSLQTIRLFFSSEVRWKAIAWFALLLDLAPVAQRPERRQQLRRPRLHDGHLRPATGAGSSRYAVIYVGRLRRLDDHVGLLSLLGGAAPAALARPG